MPSKFPSDLAEALYNAGAEEEYSSPTDDVDWWGLYVFDEESGEAGEHCMAGLILHEDNQGFVYETRYAGKEDLMAAWEATGDAMALEYGGA